MYYNALIAANINTESGLITIVLITRLNQHFLRNRQVFGKKSTNIVRLISVHVVSINQFSPLDKVLMMMIAK